MDQNQGSKLGPADRSRRRESAGGLRTDDSSSAAPEDTFGHDAKRKKATSKKKSADGAQSKARVAKLKEESNPGSTGAGGSTFEHRVQAYFTTCLITGKTIPGTDRNDCKSLRFQSRAEGHYTDDIRILFNDDAKTLVQIKLSLSFGNKDPKTQETLVAAFEDFSKSTFNRDRDRIMICLSHSPDRFKKIIQPALGAAMRSDNVAGFKQAIEANGKRVEWFNCIRTLLDEPDEEDLFNFFKIMTVITLDLDQDYGNSHGVALDMLSSISDDANWCRSAWHAICHEIPMFNKASGEVSQRTLKESRALRLIFEKRKGPITSEPLWFDPLDDYLGLVTTDHHGNKVFDVRTDEVEQCLEYCDKHMTGALTKLQSRNDDLERRLVGKNFGSTRRTSISVPKRLQKSSNVQTLKANCERLRRITAQVDMFATGVDLAKIVFAKDYAGVIVKIQEQQYVCKSQILYALHGLKIDLGNQSDTLLIEIGFGTLPYTLRYCFSKGAGRASTLRPSDVIWSDHTITEAIGKAMEKSKATSPNISSNDDEE